MYTKKYHNYMNLYKEIKKKVLILRRVLLS